MLESTTGEVVKMTMAHEGNNVREFYSTLPRPVRVGIEATGSMQWFVNLMKSRESNAWSVIRRGFEQPSHGFDRIRQTLPRWSINPRYAEIPLLLARYGADAGISGAAALCVASGVFPQSQS
jgi:hypothetical protein